MRRASWYRVAGAVAAGAALVVGAVLANGFDVTQTKLDTSALWALKTDVGQYGRVDTDLDELTTVKNVGNPDELVQTSDHVLLYAQNEAKVAQVSLSQPADLDSGDEGFASTPAGTAQVASSGGYVGYLTAAGAVYAARASSGAKGQQLAVAPPAAASGSSDAQDAQKRAYSADAIAVGTDGILYAYSHAAGGVLRFDIDQDKVLGTDPLPGGPSKAGSALTVVGDSWVLLAPGGGGLWIDGHKGEVSTGLGPDAVLQQASAAHGQVIAADGQALYAYGLGNGTRTTLDGGLPGETPAAPYWQGNRLYAAWLQSGAHSGVMWAGKANMDAAPKGAAKTLSFGGSGTDSGPTLQRTPAPVFRTNGSQLILNETVSGWIWKMPSGALVPSSQNWTLAADTQHTSAQNAKQQAQSSEPKPPVAVPDRFGVRPGALVQLPVLLNDHDPNEDVLSIIPGQVKGLDPSFGTVTVTDGGQSLAVQVAATATGTATFRYAITDGTTVGGLNSQPATVTLSVHAAGNAAPVWCGDPGCLLQWPHPQLAPGGTVTVPVLRGWVDPDGDPMFVSSAVVQAGTGEVSSTPDGSLVYQQPAAQPGTSAAGQADAVVAVTISDVHGATKTQNLDISITPQPQLKVEPFGVMTGVGVPLTVDPSSHITGATGTPTITSVTAASGSGATTTIDSTGTSFAFDASKAGSYPVTMTVSDATSTVASTVRVTVLPADQKLLSTTPVTVFVRPLTDTSVDVFQAVSNPSGAVLLLSAPRPSPASGASLDVDVVGQSQLRVRGSLSSGQSGLLGTVGYTVSDGTGDAALTITGQATVYLLPDPTPQAPIAVDDSVTVRAGAQVDIPVLANDIGPDGNVVELDPASVTAPAGGGLAFGAGQVLRYLAPKTSGTVTLRYTVYSAGYPELTDSAEVHVTVLPPGGNRSPQPVTLTGRVVAGATVRIPFDGYGVDPDGDTVTLDRIVSQPAHGTASISADGSAIVYTAAPGDRGEEQFDYEVRDSGGDTATALVRIGVLDSQSDPAPVTFSDYVQVQAGRGNQVVVQPAANDLDPTGGTLKLVSVTPDAPAGSAEYAGLRSHLGAVKGSQVTITAPETEVPTTLTYTYAVANAAGDVSAGLIVVKVVTNPVPDYPIVTDTVVSAADRDLVPQGIDVVSGKVSWASGNPSSLKLSLWGAPSGVSVSGDEIKAAVPDAGLLVPFQLSGTDFSGRTVTTYGFLRVPAKADVILALKSQTPQRVDEGASVTFDMADLVAVTKGATLQLEQSAVKASGQRPKASCSASGTRVTYTAGSGAPWADSCSVPVKLIGQDSYTLLSVPITVVPKNPVPSLRPASLTANPGGAAIAYSLTQMTTWQGEPDAALRYKISYSGTLFRVEQSGALGESLAVTADDGASPGLEETVTVSVVGMPDVVPAKITLKVGPAPSVTPKGGSVQETCSANKGTSCTIGVIGAPGEVDYFTHTPLTLLRVTPQVVGCTGVRFSAADASHITATWIAGAPGGQCAVRFGVQDAQGHQSTGDRDGVLQFNLQGYPTAPAALIQTGYTSDSIDFQVVPGDAASSFPPVDHFEITDQAGNDMATCQADGRCSARTIGGVKPNVPQTYYVHAVNAIGQSKAAASTSAWAYTPPILGSVSQTPYFDPAKTTSKYGCFTVSIHNADHTGVVAEYSVDLGDGRAPYTVPAGALGTRTTSNFCSTAAADLQLTVTAVGKIAAPNSDSNTGATKSIGYTPIGTPQLDIGTLTFTSGDGDLSISGGLVQPEPNGATKSGQFRYVTYLRGSNEPVCTASGDSLSISGGTTFSGQPFTGLAMNHYYSVDACYTNGYGVVQRTLTTNPVQVWNQPASAPVGYTWNIAQDPSSTLPDYVLDKSVSANGATPPDGYVAVVDPSDLSGQPYGTAPTITVEYCLLNQAGNASTTKCSPTAAVAQASGSAPYQMAVQSVGDFICTPGDAVTGGALTGKGVPAGAKVVVDAYEAPTPVQTATPTPTPTDTPTPTPTVTSGAGGDGTGEGATGATGDGSGTDTSGTDSTGTSTDSTGTDTGAAFIHLADTPAGWTAYNGTDPVPAGTTEIKVTQYTIDFPDGTFADWTSPVDEDVDPIACG